MPEKSTYYIRPATTHLLFTAGVLLFSNVNKWQNLTRTKSAERSIKFITVYNGISMIRLKAAKYTRQISQKQYRKD